MRKEYNSVCQHLLSTEAHKISRFGRYRYIGKTQISPILEISVIGIGYRSMNGLYIGISPQKAISAVPYHLSSNMLVLMMLIYISQVDTVYRSISSKLSKIFISEVCIKLVALSVNRYPRSSSQFHKVW